MYLIQKKIIDQVLEPISRQVQKISSKKRISFAIVCIVLFYLQIFLQETSIVDYAYRYTFCIGSVLLLVFLCCLIENNIKILAFNKALIYPWISIGVLLIFSGIYNGSFEYIPLGICFFIITPVAYIMLNSSEVDTVFAVLNKGSIISFIIYIVSSFLMFPQFIINYSGLFSNPNGAGFYLTIIFAILFIEILKVKNNIKITLVKFGFIGICGALIYYTNSRTSYMAVLGIIITVVIIELFNKNRCSKIKMTLLKTIGIIIVVAIISLSNIIPLVYSVYEKTDFSKTFKIERTEERLILLEEEYSELNEKGMLYAYGSIWGAFSSNLIRSDQGLDEISAGRITIWKTYISQITFVGNSFDKEIGDLTREDGSKVGAHNTWIDLAYRGGILSAILFLLVNILAGIKSVKYAMVESGKTYSKEPVVLAISFGIIGMLSSSLDMFLTPVVFLYLISLFPFFKNYNEI